MIRIVLIGVAAGFAAALLFVSPIGGTLLAFPLFMLCGLPVALAGLAWSSLAGLIAAASAAGTIYVALSGASALIFLALFGAPIAWMCRLAGLSRPVPSSGPVEWYPTGRILLHAAGAAAIGLVIVGVIIGYDPVQFTADLTAGLVDWLAQAPDSGTPPTAAEIEPFVRFNIIALPFTTAALLVIILVVNMWLGARIAEASGRLSRPRDRLWTAMLPVEAAFLFVAGLAVSFVPGVVGQIAGAVTGAFGGALALIGLAVIHATTLGTSMRVLILVTVYVLLFFFGGFPIVFLALLGIAETFLHLRARRLGGAPPIV